MNKKAKYNHLLLFLNSSRAWQTLLHRKKVSLKHCLCGLCRYPGNGGVWVWVRAVAEGYVWFCGTVASGVCADIHGLGCQGRRRIMGCDIHLNYKLFEHKKGRENPINKPAGSPWADQHRKSWRGSWWLWGWGIPGERPMWMVVVTDARGLQPDLWLMAMNTCKWRRKD